MAKDTVPKDYAIKTCKLGKMADCCRYLGADQNGFCCLKNSTHKSYLDSRALSKEMNAQADNCIGWENIYLPEAQF